MLVVTMDFGDSLTVYDQYGEAVGRVHLLRKRKSGQYYVGFEFGDDYRLMRDKRDEAREPIERTSRKRGLGW